MICPECNENLACNCGNCIGRERGRLKQVYKGEDILECPKCLYKDHYDNWVDFDFFLATCGFMYDLGSNWEEMNEQPPA